jgi:superfamily II DNA or RNA helicase
MQLRDYQTEAVNNVRERFRAKDRSILLQLATGAGKTPIMAEIVRLAKIKNPAVRIWFVVPRRKLLEQGSKTLSAWGVEHGRIDAGHEESNAFSVFVVSKDTLIRRLDKTKRWPDIIIFDECHLYDLSQKKIIAKIPAESKVIGLTATPERLDNRPLSEIYQSIIFGPSLPSLTERGYLAPIRYFAPKIEGLQNWKFKGGEVNEDELEKIFLERAIYGDMIRYYRELALGKPTMVFCRSVKHAESVAYRFREAGYKFEPLEGSMPKRKQKTIIDAFENGDLDGITSCQICTYGVDIKGAQVAIHLRPTQSRAIYYQINGRVMRPDTEDCTIIDHVGNIAIHGHPYSDAKWNFHGKEIRAPKKSCIMCEFCEPEDERLECRRYCETVEDFRATDCPYFTKLKQRRLQLCSKCWQYGPSPCTNCGKDDRKSPKELEERDAELVEMVGPVKLALQPTHERNETESRIRDLIGQFTNAVKFDDSAVKEMIEIAHKSDRHCMWVYRTLHRGSTYMVNVELLHAIAHNAIGKKGGPSTLEKVRGWIWYQTKTLKGKK